MQLRLTLLLAVALVLGGACVGYGQDYFVGPDQLDLPSGGAPGTDGYGPYVDVSPASDQGCLAQFGLLAEGGRYRVSYLLRTDPFGTSEASVKIGVGFDTAAGWSTNDREVTGLDLPRDGSVYALSVEIAGSPLDTWATLTYRNNEAGELATVRVYGLSFTRLDRGVALTRVRPRKLLYEPGEAGFVDVTLQNFTDHEINGTLEFTLTQELDRSEVQPGVPVAVPAGQTLDVALPFPGRTLQYGCEAWVRLTEGAEVLGEVSDVFGVSDNVFKVGLGGGGTGVLGISGESGYATADSIVRDVEHCRGSYFNWWEKMFWAPSDWGDQTPETAEWISGQMARYENADRIREFIAALKPQGIKALTYVNAAAAGPPGWELVRQHPEWFYAAPDGAPAGDFNTWDLANWNDIALHTDPAGRALFGSTWEYACPDLRQTAVHEWGISDLLQSVRDLGWDGVRFDGEWAAGNDALSTANLQRLKQAMWEEDPEFLFGFNRGFSPGYQYTSTGVGPMPLLEHESRESMAGGGLYCQEVIHYWGYGPAAGQNYLLWSDYATREEAAARSVHALGGSYHFVYGMGGLNPIDRLYKFAIGTMCAVHPFYADFDQAPGCQNWGRFLTRWSSTVWDTEAQPVVEGDVDVTPAESLWWHNWAKQRVVDATSRQVIVHLLNPPLDDQIEVVTDLLPPPVSDVEVQVQVPVGQTVTKAMLLDPRQGDQATPLAITLDGSVAQVTVPQVEVWSIVVFEFSGSFALPAPRDRFTETPDAAEVAAGRNTVDRVVGAPLTAEELAGHRHWLYETDGGYSSVPARAVLDSEAGNGVAQVRDNTESSVYIGRSYLGCFPPGRYVARMRVRLEDTNTPHHPQTMNIRLIIYQPAFTDSYTYYGTPGLGYPPERTLIDDGVYHYYDLPFELNQSSCISLIGGFDTPDPAGTRALLDHIVVEQVEAYPDAALDQDPPTSVQVGGAPGPDILVVNGFTWDTYRLPEAWGSGAHVEQLWANGGQPVDFPQLAEDLAPFDVVVLADVDVSLMGLAGRRALRDYVASGGGLLLLGGPYALGQGYLSGTYVEDVLPVSVSLVRDLQPTSPPLALTAAPTPLASPYAASLLAQQPEVYWRHLVTVKPGAEVELLAGDEPVLVTSAFGEGRVAVFSAAALGTPEPGHLAFWQWEEWPQLLHDVIHWTGSLPPAIAFTDVPTDHWAYWYVAACVNAGLVGGYPDSTYRPNLTVTRDQMSVFISRALAGGDDAVPTGPAIATFSDVPTDHWAFRYVEYAVDSGVVGGYDDGTYRPAVTVTRDAMAVFIARAMVGGEEYVPSGPETAFFPDVPTDHWAFRYIEHIRGEGVTGGYDDGTYRPLVAVTRDQMAVYVQRAFDLPM